MTPSVYIAIPSYRYGPCAETTAAMMEARQDLGVRGVATEYKCITGRVVETARAELVSLFLESKCSHLWFLDDDVQVPADTVRRMLAVDSPIVAVAYPRRSIVPVEFPVYGAGRREGRGGETVVCADRAPLGCALFTRDALERVQGRFPELQVRSSLPGREKVVVSAVWSRLFELAADGLRDWIGEDFSFCSRAHCAEVPVHVLCGVAATHVGVTATFEGS